MKGKIGPEDGDAPRQNETVKRSIISKLATWVVVIYYTLEYIVGGLKARKICSEGSIILFDRYYYDHFTQPASRDLIWPFRKVLLALVKKPDIVFHLNTSSDIIYGRKPELPKRETDTQNQYMARLLKEINNVVTLETGETSIEENVVCAFRHIVGAYKKKKNLLTDDGYR